MTTATQEADLIAPDAAAHPVASAIVDATGSEVGAAPASESERSKEFEVQIAIQTIASRILGSALLERAQEVDFIAT